MARRHRFTTPFDGRAASRKRSAAHHAARSTGKLTSQLVSHRGPRAGLGSIGRGVVCKPRLLKRTCLGVQPDPPLADDALGHVDLGLLGERVVAQVDGARLGLGPVATPRLAPEPVLGQRRDGYRVLRVVGQVLVQVGQAVGVLGEGVIIHPVPVPRGPAPEEGQVHDEERADVVGPPAEVVNPVAVRPEAEARGVRVGVLPAEGGHGHRRALHVVVPELPDVRLHHLVRVDVDHLLEGEREDHVQEEDLVAPDDALLLRLRPEPRGPLVPHELHVEALGRRHFGHEGLETRRREILYQPELDARLRALHDAQHHDLEEALVQVA
mmetsp:Transcript_27566/g.92176  ORF Transcript_27566/g.92176 Transcript_27566/m.92176 type:complete len:325 (-) Transcript_27566:114-1088(-)